MGKLDLFVSVRQVDRSDPLIREEEIGSIDHIIVAGSKHPLAGQRGVTLAQTARCRWLMGANLGAVEDSIEESYHKTGVSRLRPEIETTSVLFTLAMLDGGMHLAILPQMLVARDLAAGRLVRLDIDTSAWRRPLIVATRVRGHKSPQVATFLAKLQDALNG